MQHLFWADTCIGKCSEEEEKCLILSYISLEDSSMRKTPFHNFQMQVLGFFFSFFIYYFTAVVL